MSETSFAWPFKDEDFNESLVQLERLKQKLQLTLIAN